MLGLIGFVASAIVFAAPAPTADPQTATQDTASQSAATEQATVQKSDFQGVIGMCVRWKPDASHVDEAVVVSPSSSAALNQSSPATIKRMDWTPPANYDGKWLGVNLSIGGAATPAARPDCSALAG